jgi:hypothetical protein
MLTFLAIQVRVLPGLVYHKWTESTPPDIPEGNSGSSRATGNCQGRQINQQDKSNPLEVEKPYVGLPDE